jgi:hypothetical protein
VSGAFAPACCHRDQSHTPLPSSAPQTVFGITISAEDLEPVAVAVPRVTYTKRKPNEFSFEESETMRILASQAFIKDVRPSRVPLPDAVPRVVAFLGSITQTPVPFYPI